ncbi:16S rRNA (guanine(966)-N(2))-methyltransferase RsmD [Vagococcus lutrae]|uniref:16S rRNA (guanine(966)-N(2))-methyltransferase RsmD n=1 Tax=Vagococcus lutrae TaxID=81947 RepID=UPI002891A424|nr:16S rRNA (guanine(966)-N(2))-methyltransferase RsmD [Vagococcus lutrae]MDT2824473.1 16S rRNA (guanine(966)-N(2))-methyltransferase RsmD [Vagococcus lutrae]
MRVVAGEHGGRKLKSLPGDNTRPTSDKVKGAIFNRIGPYFNGGTILDLYGGSGNLAIEALSRGCDHAVCVDRHYKAIMIIKENAALLKLEKRMTILKSHAQQAMTQLSEQSYEFDYVFLDPPYAEETIEKDIRQLLALELLTPHAQIICETDKQVMLPERIEEMVVSKDVIYGQTKITYYEREQKQ